MPVRAFAALIAFVAIAAWCEPALARSASPAQTWLVASDIHLNPYNRSDTPSLYGSDTNLALYRSAIAQMKRDVPDPAVVLLPGDFFVHGFPRVVRRHRAGSAQQAGIATMRSIARDFGRAFPRARFAIALGNNDSPCGDYRSEIGSPYLRAVARVWQPLIDRAGAAPDFVRSFGDDGYYTATLPVAGLRLVVLDSIPFSTEYDGNCGVWVPDAAGSELAWLNATLASTPAGVRNVVMMHIPPGYDVFSTQMTHGFVPWGFLQPNDKDALVAALAAPRNRVAYALAGHTHRFDFRIARGVPIVVFGSISPVYHNNPAFYALRIGPDGAIRDLDAYDYDDWNDDWQGPRDFDRMWGIAAIDRQSLEALHARLGTQPALRRAWDFSSSGWPASRGLLWPMWNGRWRIAWCAQTHPSSGFVRCARIRRRVFWLRVVIPIGIVAIALLAGAYVLTRRGKKLLPMR